jgi:hypothetical protein
MKLGLNPGTRAKIRDVGSGHFLKGYHAQVLRYIRGQPTQCAPAAALACYGRAWKVEGHVAATVPRGRKFEDGSERSSAHRR